MKMEKTLAVIGGDLRQIYAAEYLVQHGFSVGAFALELAHGSQAVKSFADMSEAAECEYILFPLPVEKPEGLFCAPFSEKRVKLKNAVDVVGKKHKVFFGLADTDTARLLNAKAEKAFDYFASESLKLQNARLTAEGIAGIIIDSLPVSVFGLHTAITGFGRVGYFTAVTLKTLGADVTVFARNSVQRTKAQLTGLKAEKLDKLQCQAADFECIINTIPAPSIGEDIIAASENCCLFIEAASKPGGIDFDCAEKYDRTAIKALSLPGKTAPKTAGVIIGETIRALAEEVENIV